MSELDGRLKLETINYAQVGWDSIHNSNVEKLNDFVEGLAAQDPVLDKDLSTPPVSPSICDRYIIGATADGDWAGKEEYITEWNGTEWRFTAPIEGAHCYVLDESLYYLYESGSWSIHSGLTPANTDFLTEGTTNLYFSGKTTDDLTEGTTNLYASVDLGLCDGRLTITTGVPVTTSDVTAAGTLYFTPYRGNGISLYSGTKWTRHFFTELSLSLTITDAKNYDVFIYDNSGTLTLELSDAWTDGTTRVNALALQDGIYVKSGATTRRWVGTIRASGTNTTEDSETKRFVWNAQNQVSKILKKFETTDTWTYTTDTWRSANNSSDNRVSVVGGGENPLQLILTSLFRNSSAGVSVFVNFGEDSTSTPSTNSTGILGKTYIADGSCVAITVLKVVPTAGYHYYQWMEKSNATGTTTWSGDGGAPGSAQSGILGKWEC